MDIISVIVPVFNVEQYLDRCVESIVRQTYKEIEIILIDDGSSDRSGEMCDLWKKKDSRITVIHKANGGLSDARNAGIEKAKGNYIVFVDSDDWIHRQYLEILYSGIKEYNADIAACKYIKTSQFKVDAAIQNDVLYKEFSPYEALQSLLNQTVFEVVVWNKLYRAGLLQDECFITDKYHEDEFFTYRIIDKAKKLIFTSAELYYYFQREGSIMSTNSIKHLDALDAFYERILFLEKKYPELYRTAKLKYCKACVYYYIFKNKYDKKTRSVYKKRIKDGRGSISFSIKELDQYRNKDKIIILGSKYNIWLMSLLLKHRIEREQKAADNQQ